MGAFGSLEFGSSVDYYTKEIGHSATNYYTGAVAKGEPPGYWQGKGAEKLGLRGNIKAEDMKRLYEKGLDPRDPSGATKYGPAPRNFRTAHERMMERLTEDSLVSEQRVAELRQQAVTFSTGPDSAEKLLEKLVGQERGMLAEEVDALRTSVARKVRSDNRFADYTWSVSKDVTVMHTAAEFGELEAGRSGRTSDAARYRHVRERIEHWASEGNRAALAYLNKHAGYARLGRHPGGTWSPAREWVVATFPQQTSRAQDPQLHFHNPIYLPTEVPEDGKLHKIHTSLLGTSKHAAAAIGSRVMMEGLAKELGWSSALRTDGNCYELSDVDRAVMDLFSHGAQTINAEAQRIIDEYREVTGHDPIPLAITRIKQNLALMTRAPKPKDPPTREQLHREWDEKLRAEIGAGMARQAIAAGRVRPSLPPMEFSPSAVMKVAIARVQQGKSTWRRSDLAVEIEKALPPVVGLTKAEDIIDLIDTMTDVAINSRDLVVQVTNQATSTKIPADQLLDNGHSAYVEPGSTRYASRDHIASEHALQRAAIVRGRAAADADKVKAWVKERSAMGLGADQEAALIGVATSGAALSVIIGPAGTGKTYVAGGLAQCWHDLTGGKLVGLATSEQATDVLRGEKILAKNIAQWLAAQRRIAAGKARAEDMEYQLKPDDIIMPDEASMADTDKLAEIRHYVEAAGARALLIGDHRQLSAVGAGGAMSLVAETSGADVHELREVRRFHDPEEGQKSLDVRAGKVEALEWYDMHARIRDGGTEEEAVAMAARMYLGDRLRGETSVVVTPTNRLAGQVNAVIRAKLVEVGRVTAEGIYLDRDGNMAGVGDLIMCRRNNWGDPAALVKNRGRYLVTGHGDNGELMLREEKTGREIVVDREYVRDWVELGYAGTVHAVQGGTWDNGIPIVDESQPLESFYPAITRGRNRNTAIVITKKVVDQPDQYWHGDQPARDPKAVIAEILERDNQEAKSALELLREDAERAASMATISRRIEDSVDRVVKDRTADWLDRLTVDGALSADDRVALAADRATTQVGRLLRTVEQAGHDPEVALREAVSGRDFAGARSPGQVLYSRILDAHHGRLEPDLDRLTVPPKGASPEYEEHLEELHDLARLRQMQLGAQATEEQPGWAVETLGWLPDEPVARAEWEHRAGVIAAQREAMGWDDPGAVLPPAPGTLHPEQRFGWYAAHTAAGKPEATAEETILSEGALRARVEAMREEMRRMPAPVHEQLRAVEREKVDHLHEAAIYLGQAESVTDDNEHERLMQLHREAEARAARMEDKRRELHKVVKERELWREETAVTRELGERAMRELADRDIRLDEEPDRTTAEEWLAAHRESMKAEDPHRVITEVDAPKEVYDYDLEDLVQLPTAIEDTTADDRADVPAAPAADVVDVDAVDVPVQLQVPDEEPADAVDAELVVEDDEDRCEAPEPVKVDLVVAGDDTDTDVETVAAPAAEADIVDAEIVEEREPAAEQEADARAAEGDLPEDVPTDAEVETAAAAAALAADELDDRRSLERERDARVGYRHEEQESYEAAKLAEEEAARAQAATEEHSEAYYL